MSCLALSGAAGGKIGELAGLTVTFRLLPRKFTGSGIGPEGHEDILDVAVEGFADILGSGPICGTLVDDEMVVLVIPGVLDSSLVEDGADAAWNQHVGIRFARTDE